MWLAHADQALTPGFGSRGESLSLCLRGALGRVSILQSPKMEDVGPDQNYRFLPATKLCMQATLECAGLPRHYLPQVVRKGKPCAALLVRCWELKGMYGKAYTRFYVKLFHEEPSTLSLLEALPHFRTVPIVYLPEQVQSKL